MSSKPTWISEEEASKMMNYHPRYFRMLVKRGDLAVSFRTLGKDARCGYEYDQKDIEKEKNKTAVLIH